MCDLLRHAISGSECPPPYSIADSLGAAWNGVHGQMPYSRSYDGLSDRARSDLSQPASALLAALPSRPFRVRLRLSLREWRRLPLARPQRGLQLGLQVVEPLTQPLVVSVQAVELSTQLPALVERAPQYAALVVGGRDWIVG